MLPSELPPDRAGPVLRTPLERCALPVPSTMCLALVVLLLLSIDYRSFSDLYPSVGVSVSVAESSSRSVSSSSC